MNKEVIFLIDSEQYDRNILGLTLEKYTKCRVFNFFSFEETLLYKHLNPKLILHDNGNVDASYFEEKVSFYNISGVPKTIDTSEFALSLASEVKYLV